MVNLAFLQTLNAICLSSVLMINVDPVALLTILHNMGQIYNALDRLTDFNYMYDDLKTNMKTYSDMWNNLEFRQLLPQQELKGLTLQPFEFKRDKFKLGLDEKFTIPKGSKFAIIGESGSGKSTLIRLLNGDLSGLSYAEGDPKSVTDSIRIVSQDIIRSFPTQLSLQQLFNNIDEHKIRELCNIVELTSWVVDKKISQPIENKISGGQEKRLALASMLA